MAQETAGDRSGIRLFSIRGIELRIDYSWFVVFALVLVSLSMGYFPQVYPNQPNHLYWLTGFVASLLFFLSVVTHELTHSFMALRSGVKIHGITLFIFGGMARLSEEADDPRTEFKIAMVGPLTSLVLAALFWLVQWILRGEQPSILIEMLGYLAWVNLALALFNLLPGFPLDGGRLLRAFWWWKSGSLVDATRLAADWGKGLAIVLMVFGGLQIFAGSLVGGLWLIFIGMFLRGIAEASYQNVLMQRSLEGTRVEQAMTRDVVSVPPELPVSALMSEYFLRYGYRNFPVRGNGTAEGWISLADVKEITPEQRERKTVSEAMVRLDEKMIVSPQAPVSHAFRKMTEQNMSRLIVVGPQNEMLGLITKTGVLRYLEIQNTLSAS